MKHLAPSEIVDAVEGRSTAAHARHLGECADCRQQVDSAHYVLRRTSEVDLPEPSPLFWEHFSTRVRDRIAAERLSPDPERIGWTGSRRAIAFATAVAIVILVEAVLRAPQPQWLSEPPAIFQPDPGAAREIASADDAWAAVRSAAENARLEDVHDAGIVARPGAADSAIDDLSDEERRQLLELLEREIKQSGA